jgi:hypothetical protein
MFTMLLDISPFLPLFLVANVGIKIAKPNRTPVTQAQITATAMRRLFFFQNLNYMSKYDIV